MHPASNIHLLFGVLGLTNGLVCIKYRKIALRHHFDEHFFLRHQINVCVFKMTGLKKGSKKMEKVHKTTTKAIKLVADN